MKNRSESMNKSKGNGSAKHRSGSGVSDSSAADGGCPREQMIAEAAYFRAQQRGFMPGNEMSDWLQAESDIERLSGVSQ